jgi:selenide,water dikinase
LAQVLRPLDGIFSQEQHPNLIIGLSEPDDAAVYQIDEHRGIISTTDFFPPVVDSPYDFGAIAAANALSDVYAMGGRPLMAINLVAFPDGLDMAILSEILRGGADKVKEAGAVIAGGHTITDKEPKYGLSVTGDIDIDKLVRKSGARVGDRLILSKALGSGVMTTALKQGKVTEADIVQVIRSMSHLNHTASRLAVTYGVHAMTDITGFGLLGHAYEMADLSDVMFEIEFDRLQWFDGVMMYAAEDVFAGGMYRNQLYYADKVEFQDKFVDHEQGLLYDPQTSGGLLMAVAEAQAEQLLHVLVSAGEQAFYVGRVVEGNGELIVKRS